MEEHLEEEYPLLVELLRKEGKDWKWGYKNLDLDTNIEDMIGKTSWGLLELVEKKLRELDTANKVIEHIRADIGQSATMSCPYDHDFGCRDGFVCRFHITSETTAITQTSVLCRSWDTDRKCCIRIDGRGQ